MSGKTPYDRAQEMQRRDQGSLRDNKERLAEKDATIREQARTHDDEEKREALDSGETPGDGETGE